MPQEKLNKLQQLVRAAVDGEQLYFRKLQRIAGEMLDHDDGYSAGITVDARGVSGDRGPREVTSVHRGPYARLTG